MYPFVFFLSDILPMCNFYDNKTIEQVSEQPEGPYISFKRDVGHLRPCHILELKTVYKEYLIFDMVGMIGSVGGTLGMFIGFSFSGIISTIFGIILNLTDKI